MKTIISLLNISLIISGIMGFTSCENHDSGNTGKGKAEFSLNMPSGKSQHKSGQVIDSGVVSYQLLVSIEDLSGDPILSDLLIPLYSFGTGYVSENVELNSGEYILTKYMVINSEGVVAYAAPLAGSPLAYLTNRPLPLSFNIYPDRVTRVLPEVLAVEDQSPDQFGYANFGIQIIEPLVFWTTCILNDSLVLSSTQMTQANLTIYADSCEWNNTFKLEAAVNRLIIRAGSANYRFLLEKDGYPPQEMQFSVEDLLATSKENPLILKIPINFINPNDSILYENFESYSSGSFPNSWVADGNGTNISENYIDTSIFYNGDKSLKLFGSTGGCWAAIAYHTFNPIAPFIIEFAIRNGNEILSGCNPDRALVGLNTGTSWTNISQRTLIKFSGDGNVYGGGGTKLSLYNNDTWYQVKIRYERISKSEMKLSYWINDNYLGNEFLSTISEENLLNNLEIQVLEGSAWYDDIKVIN
jgi:hypothetical protein